MSDDALQAPAADALDPEDCDDESHDLAPAISGPPIHLDQEQPWRQRARDYDSRYKGPVHWRVALNVLAATGSLPLALREANISRGTFNKRRERYPEFAEAIVQANEYFTRRTLEQTAVMRAVDGVVEDVWHKGIKVGQRRVLSDTLLIRLLEGNIPEKYKPKMDVTNATKIEVVGGLPTGGPSEEELALAADEAATAAAAAAAAKTE